MPPTFKTSRHFIASDSIWGIGCDACNEKAVERIIKLKKRSPDKSMIVLLDTVNNLNHYVPELNEKILEILNTTVRPTTIVYNKVQNLSHNVYANDGSVAIRIVKDPFCQILIRKLGTPIVSTSANISNEPSPTHFRQITKAVLDGVDYVVNLQQDNMQQVVPSTILKVDSKGNITVLRK